VGWCACQHVCMPLCVRISCFLVGVNVFECVCICVHQCVCVCACICVRTCVCAYVLVLMVVVIMHVHTHKHLHTNTCMCACSNLPMLRFVEPKNFWDCRQPLKANVWRTAM